MWAFSSWDPDKQKARGYATGSLQYTGITHRKKRQDCSADFRLTEYRCSIMEVLVPIWAAGAETSSRNESFVCRTTPHYGSTLREASYSVRPYDTRN